MGLDIKATSKIVTEITDPIAYEFNKLLDADVNSFYVNLDFPNHSSDFGVKSGSVDYIEEDGSETFEFRVGSYSTYNKLRNLICLAIHGIKAEEAWDNPSVYSTKALWDLLNFSDCEGTIDTTTSARILKDLLDNTDKFANYIKNDTDIGEMDTEHYIESYSKLIKCFTLGADGGIVLFG